MGIESSIKYGLKMITPTLIVSILCTVVAESAPFPYDSGGSFSERRLNFNNVAGYEPLTEVIDLAAIDLDQSVIEKLVDFGLVDAARAMYEHGGHSQSIARIRLFNADPPKMTVPMGTRVIGITEKGDVVEAKLIEDVVWTDNSEEVVLPVEYGAALDQSVFCRLGGLAELDSADLSGCFAPQGVIQILDFQEGAPVYHYNYTYDTFVDTYNKRTIQSLSTEIDMSFGDSKHWDKFATYYDAYDYADQWIQAALNARSTDFLNGNADFSMYGPQSRKEALPEATKLMNFFMYVIRMMEFAQVRCNVPCGSSNGSRCDDTPIRAWDQAVAFYAGSLEGKEGESDGVLLYDLADRMCVQFKTCSASGDMDEGPSFVNLEIIKLFAQGQFHLLRRECGEADAIKEQIINIMTVPIVQVNLFSAHIRNYTGTLEEVQSSTYAASILPIVHHCSQDDAEEIYSNLGLTQSDGVIDVAAVKKAFENNYGCMGITCKMVGGVWEGSSYGEFSAPCDYQESNKKSQSPLVTAILVLVCASVAALMVYFVMDRFKKESLNHYQNRYPDQGLRTEEDVIPRDRDFTTVRLD